jgi:sigma-B regulation protein RsbU (phosphoserine phosphatase)
LFFGCYDDRSRSLGYVNCGHTPPLLLRRSGAVDRLDATGMVLGLLETWDGALAETRLEPNDLLTIYTDGVTETTDTAGQEFGEARLLDILQQSKNLDPAGVLSEVEKALEQFRPTERLHDDLTLVVARGR